MALPPPAVGVGGGGGPPPPPPQGPPPLGLPNLHLPGGAAALFTFNPMSLAGPSVFAVSDPEVCVADTSCVFRILRGFPALWIAVGGPGQLGGASMRLSYLQLILAGGRGFEVAAGATMVGATVVLSELERADGALDSLLPRAFQCRHAAVRAIFSAVRSAGLPLIRPTDLQLRPALPPQGAAPYALAEEAVRFSPAIDRHHKYSLAAHVSLGLFPDMRGFLIVSCLVGGLGLPLDRVANDPIVEPRQGLAGLEAVVWASSTPQERMVTSTTPHAAWRTWCENFLKGGPPGLVQVPFGLSEFNAAEQLLRDFGTGDVTAIVRCLPELTVGCKMMQALVLHADGSVDDSAQATMLTLMSCLKIRAPLTQGSVACIERSLAKLAYVLFPGVGGRGHGADDGGLGGLPGLGAQGQSCDGGLPGLDGVPATPWGRAACCSRVEPSWRGVPLGPAAGSGSGLSPQRLSGWSNSVMGERV